MADDLVAIDVNDIKNLQALEDMEIGETTRHSLSTQRRNNRKEFLTWESSFWQQFNIFKQNCRWQTVHCVIYSVYNQQHAASLNLVFIRRLARKLPQVISPEEGSAVTDEWKAYSVENISRSWYCLEESAEDASYDAAANERQSMYPVDQ